MKIKHIIILFVVSILMCGSASAWLSGYDYQRPIEINNTGNNLTNWQYNFTIDTATLVSAGKMNINGSDCRITNNTDVLQEFWNETAFNDSNTKIWVNATELNNITNTTHYIYYGKSNAIDITDISSTFEFGDNFDTNTFTIISEPTNPTRIADDAWEGACLCEQSDFHYGGEYISWYRGHGSGAYQIGFENSTDGISWTGYSGNPILADSDIGFPYVVQVGDCFYMFAKKPTTGGKLYLYNVTADYTDPIIMNGGNPVLEVSQSWEGTEIYNLGVEVVGDTWHMVYDAILSPPYSMGYTYSNLTEMNWTIHKSVENPIITGDKANPYLKYVPDRNSLLMLNTIKVGGTYEIGAHYASLSDNLSLDASWHLAPNFQINHSGVHATDPHAMFNFNATYPTMISYNYNQAQTYQAYLPHTLNEFFDTVTTGPLSNFDSYGTFSYNIEDSILSIATTGSNYGILKGKTNISMPAIVEWRGKASATNIFARTGFSTDATSTPLSQVLWWWGFYGNNQRGYCYLSGTPTFSAAASLLPFTTYENWEVKWISSSSVKYYQNNTYQLEVTSNIPTSDMPAWLISGFGAGTNYWDWIFVRQYADSEPIASLGTEEGAPSEINIILNANEYGLLRKNGTIDQTFSQIATTIDNDVYYTWYNSTSGLWESFAVGYTYNDDLIIPKNESYFVAVNTDTTISCTEMSATNIGIPGSKWFSSYLRETVNKTLSSIKTDMNGEPSADVWELYAWNNSSQSWINSSTYMVNPNEGLLIYSNATFTWDGNVS